MINDLITLHIDNTGDKININVNGEDWDISSLSEVNINILPGVCKIETRYNDWYSLKHKQEREG